MHAGPESGSDGGDGAAPHYLLRLYVAGQSPNSAVARRNLQKMCERHLPDRHQIQIVDLLRSPERALDDSVFVTPTLIRLWPEPVVRVLGSLSSAETILEVLGIEVDPDG